MFCTYLLHEVLSQDGEALCVRLLGSLTLHQVLQQSLKALDIVEHSQGSQQNEVLFSQVSLVFLVDVTLVGFSCHIRSLAHEKGRLHEV